MATARVVGCASRLARLGSGSVIGGRAALLVDGHLLSELAARHKVVLVSATNGKTTTTRLLASAMATKGPVVSNAEGANMAPGHVAALAAAPPGATAVLEVDEGWLGKVMSSTRPEVVVLLNLSRDQLDRSHEVRQVAQRWRSALTGCPPRVVVANADDPLVAWAATAAPLVEWVAAGSSWTADAVGCPACGGRLDFGEQAWSCDSCDLSRPTPGSSLAGSAAVLGASDAIPLDLALPGRINASNALVALVAARSMGADPQAAATAMSQVAEVAGRYRRATFAGAEVRLLLAKNPAGWQEALDLLAPAPAPVIVAINARVADGHDPSWLWDVPFERLRGRRVVAAGERRSDLAVRLAYADVDHVVADDLAGAVAAAGGREVDVAANYTAFQGYLAEVGS